MRKRIEAFINHPITDLCVATLILSSVALLVLEATLPVSHEMFELMELAGHALTGVFIVELMLRFLGLPNRKRFLRMYWVDVLAVLPVTRPLRILRVLRLLRLFRLGTLINRRLSVLGATFRQGAQELLTVGVVVLIVVLAGAIGMNLVERNHNQAFESMGDSTWWSLYALVAGEPVLGTPSTFIGRVLALFVMLCGLGFFAIFTGIISAAMVSRLSSRMEVKEMALEDLYNHIIICGWNRVAIRVLEELQADVKLRSTPIVLVAELESPPDLGPLAIIQDRLFFVRGDHTKVDVLQKAGSERAKIAIGSAHPLPEEQEITLRGRNLITGLPESIDVSSVEVREALSGPLNLIIEAIHNVVDETPPELVSDLMEQGIALAGGGALLQGMAERLSEETKIRVYVTDDPLTCVARGAGKILEELDSLKKILVSVERGSLSH